MREVKLAISIPSARDWKPRFGSSLVGLVRHLTKTGVDFDINIMAGASILPRARQLAIGWARSIKATHLLCLDDDMQFPMDIADRLLAHDKEIVACNYVSKVTQRALIHGLDGQLLTSEGRSGLEEVGWVGFGVILIRMACLDNINPPFFEQIWNPERQDFIGEDFYFCKKVREHGVKIYVDHSASQAVGHIGDQAFGFPQKLCLAEAAE